MKKTYGIIFVISIALAFSACGGSSGTSTISTTPAESNSSTSHTSSQDEVNNTVPSEESIKIPEEPSTVINKITLEVKCTTPASISEYFELQSQDKIVKETQESMVKIYHDEEGLKHVCLERGEVFVQRSEVQ